jgi:hypothetical protein
LRVSNTVSSPNSVFILPKKLHGRVVPTIAFPAHGAEHAMGV